MASDHNGITKTSFEVEQMGRSRYSKETGFGGGQQQLYSSVEPKVRVRKILTNNDESGGDFNYHHEMNRTNEPRNYQD